MLLVSCAALTPHEENVAQRDEEQDNVGCDAHRHNNACDRGHGPVEQANKGGKGEEE